VLRLNTHGTKEDSRYRLIFVAVLLPAVGRRGADIFAQLCLSRDRTPFNSSGMQLKTVMVIVLE
jgi:hypothetical protein